MKKNYVISIFIDLEKALDMVYHDILLYELECYGIRRLVKIHFSNWEHRPKSWLVYLYPTIKSHWYSN